MKLKKGIVLRLYNRFLGDFMYYHIIKVTKCYIWYKSNWGDSIQISKEKFKIWVMRLKPELDVIKTLRAKKKYLTAQKRIDKIKIGGENECKSFK